MTTLIQVLPGEPNPLYKAGAYYRVFPGAHACLVPLGDPDDARFLCVMAGTVPFDAGTAPAPQLPLAEHQTELHVYLSLPDALIAKVRALQQAANDANENVAVRFEVEQHVPYFAANGIDIPLQCEGDASVPTFRGGSSHVNLHTWIPDGMHYETWLDVRIRGPVTLRSLGYHLTLVGRIVREENLPPG